MIRERAAVVCVWLIAFMIGMAVPFFIGQAFGLSRFDNSMTLPGMILSVVIGTAAHIRLTGHYYADKPRWLARRYPKKST